MTEGTAGVGDTTSAELLEGAGLLEAVDRIEFFFDPMCPWAYQTSLWMREVRRLTGLTIDWRFFSLEEINRPEGKRHPWERPIAYGWTPMRIAALLRRDDMAMCDDWYAACGHTLHREGRRPYEEDVARELLEGIGAPADTWDRALADPTTHDDVRNDHLEAVESHGGFGVPIIVLPEGRALFGPVVVPAPMGDAALQLWRLTVSYARFPGLFELKTPKTAADQRAIAEAFTPYLSGRQWETIQKPAP